MIKSRISQWLARRFQFNGHKNLKQRDILIFIYQQGYLYLGLIVITFIAGVNYANNLILGFCFLITAILCISFYLTFKQLHEMDVEIRLPEIGRVAEALTLHFHFKQQRISPKYLIVKIDGQLHSVLLKDQEKHFEFTLIPEKRGKFEIPMIQLYSTYPLGLVRAWTYFYVNKSIWIAPEIQYYQNDHMALNSSGLPDVEEFKELRDYQLGDSLQAVSWKQAARGQGLYIKQFEDQTEQQAMKIDYARMPSSDHEERLKFMMGLVEICNQKQMPYSMVIHHQTLDHGIGIQHDLHAKIMLAQA